MTVKELSDFLANIEDDNAMIAGYLREECYGIEFEIDSVSMQNGKLTLFGGD